MKGLVRKGPVKCKGLGHEFLARPALTQNQHRMRALSRLGDNAVKLFHLRRAPDDIAKALARLNGFAQHAVLGL
jgi:hypothetical protein